MWLELIGKNQEMTGIFLRYSSNNIITLSFIMCGIMSVLGKGLNPAHTTGSVSYCMATFEVGASRLFHRVYNEFLSLYI